MDIKDVFLSEKTGKSFKKCVFCEDDLLSSENGYVIEKAFRYNEKSKSFDMIFEYGLCVECIQKLSKEMSVESSRKVQLFLENYKFKTDDIERRLSTCLINDTKLDENKEYQIAGVFLKNEMLVSEVFPYAIGEEAIEHIQNLISEKTRDFSDKFKDLILPPDVREKFPKDRIVIF